MIFGCIDLVFKIVTNMRTEEEDVDQDRIIEEMTIPFYLFLAANIFDIFKVAIRMFKIIFRLIMKKTEFCFNIIHKCISLVTKILSKWNINKFFKISYHFAFVFLTWVIIEIYL